MSAINDTTTMRRFSPPTTPGQQHHAATAKEREEENDDEKNLRGLSEFERMRERRIAKNMQRMREMGLEKIAAPFRRPIVIESASSSSQTPRKVRPKTKRFVFLSRRRRASVECFLHLCRRLCFLFPSSPQSSRAFAEEKRRPKLPLIDKIRSTEKESCFDTGKSATTHVSSREEDKLRRRRRTDERRK